MATVAIAEHVPVLRLHRISYQTYEQMVESGMLTKTDRVELLDGLLVEKMTKGASHSTAVLMGQEALRISAPTGWHVRPEQPVVLLGGPNGDSSPEPDLMIGFGDLRRYRVRQPLASEVGLVMEIDSSPEALAIDRAGLIRYAHAGIPIACIVDLVGLCVEVHRSPANGSYREREILRPGQDLTGEIGTPTTGPAVIAPVPIADFFDPI